MLLREFRQHRGANCGCGMPTKSGVQHVWTHADSADSLDVANREIRILLSQRMALGITDEDLSQRTNLHGLPIEARRFDPRIFLLAIPASEFRLGLSGLRMESLATLIIGVCHIFAD